MKTETNYDERYMAGKFGRPARNRYRAYVIYGGQWVYARSKWHDNKPEAHTEGLAEATAAEQDFVGVVCDGPDTTDFERILLKGLEKTGKRGIK